MTLLFSPQFLRSLRNDIPIDRLIADILDIPHKHSEGYFRFLCPLCSEFNTAVNPNTNLARCFRCKKNFNTIDIVMVDSDSSFLVAANLIKSLLPRFRGFT
jgi:DNA primase